MRQTSRAVALLLTLESANAAAVAITAAAQSSATPKYPDYVSQFNPNVDLTPATALSSHSAPFNPVLLNSSTWATPTAVTATMPTGATGTQITGVSAGSGCMQCIGGNGVWCSRTYAYASTALLQGSAATTGAPDKGFLKYPNGDPSATASGNAVTEAMMAAGAAKDNGSCCAATLGAVITQSGQVGVATAYATTTQAQAAKYVGEACVAYQNSDVTVYNSGTTTDGFIKGRGFDTATVSIFSSWWCSNGLYKKTLTSANNVTNVVQPLMRSSNMRKELAFAACPQINARCGSTNSALKNVNAFTAVSGADVVITILAASGLTASDKCTWVASCTACAPTFTIGQPASGGLGLVSPNWQIHSMEYTGLASGTTMVNGSLVQTQTTGYRQLTDALATQNRIPMFDMPANQFNTLRTWYGKGTSTMGTNWLAPYQNSSVTTADSTNMKGVAGQWQGNVANFPNSSLSLVAGATGTYGSVSSVTYDARVVRYFPAQVAAASWTAGDSLYGAAGSYAAAVTTYTTAKTNWDAYVAILKKNAKADAFAAAFSPPKAPTVPPLPAQPWVPGAYAGYIKQTPAENRLMMLSASLAVSTTQPTNQQFWTSQLAAETIGGWGTFTAQILAYRNGWGKSFGTIGYSGDAKMLDKSTVWYYPWTCTTGTGVAGELCDKIYNSGANNITTAPPTVNAVNAVPLYVAVSLWSIGNAGGSGVTATAAFVGKSNFVLTFSSKAWDTSIIGYKPFTALTATTAASSLTGIAGAQALAASAAAALAAAAALY